jgi:hypothetical protein
LRNLRAQRAAGSDDGWAICGKGSHIDTHAGREIALRIVRLFARGELAKT